MHYAVRLIFQMTLGGWRKRPIFLRQGSTATAGDATQPTQTGAVFPSRDQRWTGQRKLALRPNRQNVVCGLGRRMGWGDGYVNATVITVWRICYAEKRICYVDRGYLIVEKGCS